VVGASGLSNIFKFYSHFSIYFHRLLFYALLLYEALVAFRCGQGPQLRGDSIADRWSKPDFVKEILVRGGTT
jgi:hypothetical protein